MKRTRWGWTGAIFGLAVVSFVTASCSDDAETNAAQTCTPGASNACVGPGGCAGGQACNAQGTGYEPCDCSGGPPADGGASSSDSSTPDGQEVDSSVAPSEGAIRVKWTLKSSGGAPLTCSDVPAQDHVLVTLTAHPTTTVKDSSFTCGAGQGDVVDLPFGTYTVVAALVNAQDEALGSAPQQTVTLAAAPCDVMIDSDCGKSLDVTITVD